MLMFDGTRNPILDPLKIKRMINGQYLTLDVIETSYDRETHLVLLYDENNYEFYEGKFINQQFIEIEKLEEHEG